MNSEKINYVIEMIKDMDLENKLRLAICMCDSDTTHFQYDKKEMYKYFDSLLKEINIEYRTTIVNFANYPYIIFAMAKIMEMDAVEQNKVALFLFNNIFKSKFTKIDKRYWKSKLFMIELYAKGKTYGKNNRRNGKNRIWKIL